MFAGLTVDENLRLAERDGEPRYELVYDLFPELQRARQAAGGDALRRPAADGRDRAGAPEREPGAARRRADEGACAAPRHRGRRACSSACRELTTVLLVEQNLGVVARVATRRGRARHRARRAHRPCAASCSTTGRRSSGCSEWGTREHLRPAHDHRARARRDVLPDRLGAVADLRPDGRPQLRTRRLPDRRRLRPLVHGVEARRPLGAAALPARRARRPRRRRGLRGARRADR